MQNPNRVLIDHRGRLAAALKDVGRTVQQRLLPLMDHRRMNLIGRFQLGHCPLALHGVQPTRALDPASWFLRFFIV